jgi:hypothetical protein
LTIRNSREWLTVPIDRLKPYARRVRIHSRSQMAKLKKVIGHFGRIAPVIIDSDYVVIDGNAVVEAMRELGAGEIAVVMVAGRTDPEIKVLRLALNQLSTEAAWNNKELRTEFEELLNFSFDLVELTGFDTAEINHVVEFDLPTVNVVEDRHNIIPSVGAVALTKPGDIWLCGHHRLGCGNAHDQQFVDRVLAGALADACFIDPSFCLPVASFAPDKGCNKSRELALEASGETSTAHFTTYLVRSLKVIQAACSPHAHIYACTNWRRVFDLISAGRACKLELSNVCVWTEANAETGSLYRDQHELVCVFTAEGDAHDTTESCRRGRKRSNLWTYRSPPTLNLEQSELKADRPTVKPVAMAADVLRDVTKRRGKVLDTFVGPGSTVMAAEETGRICFGTEIDPLYLDVAIRRWQASTGRDAVNAETGELFNARAKRLAATRIAACHD